MRRGLPGLILALPHVGGSDIAGEVDALGPGADGVEPGDRVDVDPSLGWRWHEGLRLGGRGVQEGHRLLEEGQVFGKVVVEPNA